MLIKNSFPINVSSIIDFLSYFPPPPPMIPAPPPRRLWTCSSHSSSSLSCFVSDDRNPREYIPIHVDQQSKFIENTSQLNPTSSSNEFSSLTKFFHQNRSAGIFFAIFLSIFLFILIISSIALSRHRRRTTTTTTSRKFYYSLLPHRHQEARSKKTNEDKSIELRQIV